MRCQLMSLYFNSTNFDALRSKGFEQLHVRWRRLLILFAHLQVSSHHFAPAATRASGRVALSIYIYSYDTIPKIFYFIFFSSSLHYPFRDRARVLFSI